VNEIHSVSCYVRKEFRKTQWVALVLSEVEIDVGRTIMLEFFKCLSRRSA
jgi:hypothetical protein